MRLLIHLSAGGLTVLGMLIACGDGRDSDGLMAPSGGTVSALGGGANTGGGGGFPNTDGGRPSRGGNLGLAGAGSDGGAGTGGAGGENSGGSPRAGECIVVQSWRTEASFPIRELRRIAGGFGVNLAGTEWKVLSDATGLTQATTLKVVAQAPLIGSMVLGNAEDPRFLLVHSRERTGYDGDGLVGVYDKFGEIVGDEHVALPIFTRGSAISVSAESPEHQLAAFSNYHGGAFDPRVVLVAPDGRAVGEAVRLLDTGEKPTIGCLSLTETMTGFLASFVNLETGALQLTELGTDGHVVGQEQWPVPEGLTCGTFWREGDRVFGSFTQRDEANSDVSQEIYSYQAGALTPVLSRLLASETYSWLLYAESPLVAIPAPNSGFAFARLHQDEIVPFTGPTVAPGTWRIHSGDGRLFFASPGEPAATDPNQTEFLDIREFLCGGVP